MSPGCLRGPAVVPVVWDGSVVLGYQQGYASEVDGLQCVLVSGGGHDRWQGAECSGFFKYASAFHRAVGVLLLSGEGDFQDHVRPLTLLVLSCEYEIGEAELFGFVLSDGACFYGGVEQVFEVC